MRMEMKVVFCVLVLLTGSPQAGGQSSALPPVLLSYAGSSSSPDLRIDDPAGSEALGTVHSGTVHSGTVHSGTVHSGTVHSGTVHSETVHLGTVHSEMTTNAVYPTTNMVPADSAVASPSDSRSSSESVQSAAPLLHTSTPESRAFLASHPSTSFSSQPAHTAAQDASSTAHASTVQPQSESLPTAATQPTTTGHHLTSAPGRGPAGPTHQEVPSELNVGDDELKGPHHRSSSPLDPLLAGLLSVFIATTAVVFVVLFLKFRQRTNHPEFHRLQDLPMDDLMEDTPLSRYTY